MAAPKIVDLIAQAIRDADSSYFFEDYSAQGRAVMEALRRSGHAVVPINPTPAMLEAGKESMRFGTQRPADLLKQLFAAMVGAAR